MIEIFNVNNKKYVFNGNTFELFEVYDQEELLKYCEENKNVNTVNVNRDNFNLAKITINMANKCNLKCRYCYAEYGNYGRSDAIMTKETIDKIIEFLKNKHIKNIGIISFFGGEPLINYNLIKYSILKFEQNFQAIHNYEITTNSIFLNKNQLNFFSNYNVNIVLSLDGPKDITDYLRGYGVYDKVMEAFEMIMEMNYTKFEFSATYTNTHLKYGYSYEDIDNFFKKMCVKYNISKVLIDEDSEFYISDILTVPQFRNIIIDDINSIYNNKNKVLNPYLYRMLTSIFLDVRSYNFCDDLNENVSLSFDYNGDVYNCFRFWGDADYVIGVPNNLKYKNDKNNFKSCQNCWAKYLCKECIAEILNGNSKYPFSMDNCSSKFMYRICLEEFINFIDKKIDIERFSNNFLNFIRYQI